MRARAFLIALAVTAVVGALFAFGFTRDPRAIPSPLIGRPAPAFTLRLFEGGTLETPRLRGRIVVVNFWASWCYPACYEEAPRLQRVWERYRERGVVVVGVNIQDQEAPARQFIRRFGLTFPNGPDPLGRISIDFGVYGVPETFVIDPQGVIVAKHVGAVTEEWLTEHVERLLRKGATP
ncbi:MAG: redoxin domain-containing protein [Armatimonadota bacterium]|nr:redoxin domain-containing protein [Armatimonadota bacterium]MDR7459202.1 redoxin domain-containing protein [Armatimonadota bacterium]MDR7479696.1 redoxin domain-containing protein [Armatimonadota bacterium]MDR7487833.1 redoxin domain-containing protein [Armatimonadota bacterium]MDR7490865.1 redoxin domain-containing protein [Armatimonadota bacterium]